MSQATQEHKSYAPKSVSCYVLTVSDTRTPETDTSGRAIRDLLEGAGHVVTGHEIVRDEPVQVTAVVAATLDDERTQVIITTGGTGITSRDVMPVPPVVMMTCVRSSSRLAVTTAVTCTGSSRTISWPVTT